MKTVTLVRAHNWVGLYIDGDLICQGNTIEEETLLQHVGVNYDSFLVDEEWNIGCLPARLEDIKEKKR